jgi:hypothetical protein
LTVNQLDDSATLVGCPDPGSAAALGGEVVGTLRGISLVSISTGDAVNLRPVIAATIPWAEIAEAHRTSKSSFTPTREPEPIRRTRRCTSSATTKASRVALAAQSMYLPDNSRACNLFRFAPKKYAVGIYAKAKVM